MSLCQHPQCWTGLHCQHARLALNGEFVAGIGGASLDLWVLRSSTVTASCSSVIGSRQGLVRTLEFAAIVDESRRRQLAEQGETGSSLIERERRSMAFRSKLKPLPLPRSLVCMLPPPSLQLSKSWSCQSLKLETLLPAVAPHTPVMPPVLVRAVIICVFDLRAVSETPPIP